MLMRQERLALLLLICVAVVVISAHLILSYIGKEPFAHPFSGSSSDGELVYCTGTIDQITITKDGEYAILQVNNTSLFTQTKDILALDLQKGDWISVYGIVQTYHGKKELVINNAEDIRRLASADMNPA